MRFSRSSHQWSAIIISCIGAVIQPHEAVAQRALGIDVSAYQGSYQTTPTHITWSSVPSSITFAWAKATEGTGLVDPDFTYNASNAKAVGIPVGAYDFVHPYANAPATEAAYFWNAAQNYIKADGLTISPMLDMETFSGYVGASSYADWCNQWCEAVVSDAAAVGVKITPVIYISACKASYLDSTVSQWTSDIANYGSSNGANDPQSGTPWSSCASDDVWGSGVWSVWQYESVGTISGINGNVDHDVFNGTKAQMLTAMLAVSTGFPAPAGTTLYWDPSLKKASPGSGGTGSWDLSTADWWYSGSSNVFWSPSGNNAVFAGTAGTVTLNTSVSAGNLTFSTAGYTLAGTATLTLTNSPSVISVASPGSSPVGVTCILHSANTTITGGGVLSLNNLSDSVTGPVNIVSNTTLVIASTRALGSGSGTITLSNGGALQNNDTVSNDAFLSSSCNIVLGTGGGYLNDNINASQTYGGVISGSGSLTKIGGGGGTGGALILNGANTYTGPTVVSQGVLGLGSAGSIASSSAVTVAQGATFDVSAQSTWAPSSGFTFQGAGTTVGGTAATIKGAANAVMDFSSSPIALIYTPSTTNSDTLHPSLYVSQGRLEFSPATTISISNASSLAIGVGDYLLMAQASGTISNMPNPVPSLSGTSFAAGTTNYLLTNGANLFLIVAHTTTTTLGSLTQSTYGGQVTFTATVSPSPSGGKVQFYDGGVALGSPVTVSSGTASYTTSALAGGDHAITAAYGGVTLYGASTSSAATQTVAGAPLSITAKAQSKTYGQTVAFGSGSTNFTAAGLLNVDTVGSVTLSVSGNAGAADAAVGTYALTPSAATGGTFSPGNYNITYNPGTLTVSLPANTTPVTITGPVMQNDGTMQLTFSGVPGYTYFIQATCDIESPIDWTTIGTNTADTNGLFNFTDEASTNYPVRYYRTIVDQ
jgi:autotransporter-associated beta strand protein